MDEFVALTIALLFANMSWADPRLVGVETRTLHPLLHLHSTIVSINRRKVWFYRWLLRLQGLFVLVQNVSFLATGELNLIATTVLWWLASHVSTSILHEGVMILVVLVENTIVRVQFLHHSLAGFDFVFFSDLNGLSRLNYFNFFCRKFVFLII